MPVFVMSSLTHPGSAEPADRPTDDLRNDEVAGADEVAALGQLLSRPAHIPAPRIDNDDDDETALLDRDNDEDTDQHVALLPRQRDEFTCARCYLVAHVSQRISNTEYCRDCG